MEAKHIKESSNSDPSYPTIARSGRMEGMLILEQAKELQRYEEMLIYTAEKALVFIKAKDREIFTTMDEIENNVRRVATIEETCEIMQSVDPRQVEDYCGPIGTYVFMAQMQQYINESRAFLSNSEKQLRDFEIRGQEDQAKRKLHAELAELLEFVIGKLSQLFYQKMKELDQFDLEHMELVKSKAACIFQLHPAEASHKEKLLAEAEGVLAELKNLTREMEILTLEKRKVYDDFHAQLESVNGRSVQLRDHYMEEVIAIKNDQLQQHTKEIGKDDAEVFSIEEASESDDKIPEDVQARIKEIKAIQGDMLADLENLKREMEIVAEKKKVHDELEAQLEVVTRKFEQEKMNVDASVAIKNDQLLKDTETFQLLKLRGIGDGDEGEVVRRIKKWESEVVYDNAIIGLKKFEGDKKELWNIKEDRVATLKEAISYLLMMLRVGSESDSTPHVCA